jgi:endonuclease/exonuclease/phosphatase family metal-dependent hydrolase
MRTLPLALALLTACITARQADALWLPPHVQVCSFNIQFLGHFKHRDVSALAEVVKDCEIVVVQELVAPPTAGAFPDGTPRKADPEAAAFFGAMRVRGFEYVLSSEDTGSGPENHKNSSATEWWVAFYKPFYVVGAMPGGVRIAGDLPSGWLATDRSDNPDYERVPYAFAFRTANGPMLDVTGTDFVLISVHLQPGSSKADRARRKHELQSIWKWVEANNAVEKDFIVLGDMNIEDCDELRSLDHIPTGYRTLNDKCLPTNTNVNGPKPYDHVILPRQIHPPDYGFEVVDLVKVLETRWLDEGPFPGRPYNHDTFRQLYSDHNPIKFRLPRSEVDDD